MRIVGIMAALFMVGCRAEPVIVDGPLPPLAKQFECLPKEAAFLAAHRGTAKGTAYPENSMSGLTALIDRGYLFAEIDIAGLKDGTHILFHDGVWEEKSTGQGVVAASTWNQVKAYLLLDTRGNFSADRPPKLADYLKAAKDKIYLEIDFKSSAKYAHVIELIRENNMGDQVILISYNRKQAKVLSGLAPEMMISASVKQSAEIARLEAAGLKRSNITAWLGQALEDDVLTEKLSEMNIPVLGMMGYKPSRKKTITADLLVTDYTFDHKPVVGLSSKSQAAYKACLKAN